jgi:hypothetical protein
MFERPPFWNGYSYSIKNYAVQASFYGINSTEFHKNLPIGSKVDRDRDTHTHTHTHRMVISLAYIFP